jgi:2Fe-2S ferredoxin
VTPHVTVEPWGITFDVRPGETIFDAAHRNGWQWPTNCYGQCRCTVCHVRVIDGTDHVGVANAAERAVLEPLLRTIYRNEGEAVVRLACQTFADGDVRVEHRRRPQRTNISTEVASRGDSQSDTKLGRHHEHATRDGGG